MQWLPTFCYPVNLWRELESPSSLLVASQLWLLVSTALTFVTKEAKWQSFAMSPLDFSCWSSSVLLLLNLCTFLMTTTQRKRLRSLLMIATTSQLCLLQSWHPSPMVFWYWCLASVACTQLPHVTTIDGRLWLTQKNHWTCTCTIQVYTKISVCSFIQQKLIMCTNCTIC